MHLIDEILSNRRIDLDGNTFERCTFVHCEFFFSARAPVQFIGPTLFTDCSWQFLESATFTLELLALLWSSPRGEMTLRRILTSIANTASPGQIGRAHV